MGKGFIFFILLLFCLNFISADIENHRTFKQNAEVTLIKNCINSTYANITRIAYPNSSFAVSGSFNMTKLNDDYSYIFNKTSLIGTYLVYGYCDENGVKKAFEYDFYITRLGFQLTTQESIIYSILLFCILLLFGACLYFSIIIPYSNVKNDFGETVLLTKAKYVKLFLIGVCYGLFVWVLNLLIGLSDSFTSLTIYLGFINMLFNVFIRISYFFFVVLLIIFVYTIIQDFKFKQKMNELWGIKI